MKFCALILSFILSFLSGGREADFSNYTYEPATEIVELRGPRAEKLICKL